MRITNQRAFSTNNNKPGEAMDNPKSRIDATSDTVGRPSGRDASGGGQNRRRGGPLTWTEMMPHIGPPPPFMYGPSAFGPPFTHRPMHFPGDGELPPMHGPSQYGPFNSSWSGRIRTMPGPSAFGPKAWLWDARLRGADDATDTESDDQHAGKDSAANVGKESHEKQDGACDDKPDQHHPSCPHGDRFRRHGMRGSSRHAHGRRRNPYGMHGRYHRGFKANSHCPPWSTGPGECHQPGHPTGWGEFPFPPLFFGPSPWDCAEDGNDDPENDDRKQDAAAQTRDAPGRFSSLVLRQRRMVRPCVRPGQKYCDKRDKLLSMLSWKRDTLKYKLQRIESLIERMQPSDDETQETTTMTTEVDASRQQASSIDVTPEEGATIDVDGDNEWEVIADNCVRRSNQTEVNNC